MLSARTLRPTDDEVIRHIFWSTLGLGTELAGLPRLQGYEELCLRWYLEQERANARMLVDAEVPQGYVLVGTRAREHRRWLRSRAVRFALTSVPHLVGRRAQGPASEFIRLRIADGWALRSGPRPMPVHAHLNLLAPGRHGRLARLAVDHVDEVSRRAGSPGWFGEVNAPVGRRAAALERLDLRVTHRSSNRTLTALTGRPVERLTVVRTLPAEMSA